MEDLLLIQGYRMCFYIMSVDQDYGPLRSLAYLDVASESLTD